MIQSIYLLWVILLIFLFMGICNFWISQSELDKIRLFILNSVSSWWSKFALDRWWSALTALYRIWWYSWLNYSNASRGRTSTPLGGKKGKEIFFITYSFFLCVAWNVALGCRRKSRPNSGRAPFFSLTPRGPFMLSPVMYNLHIVRI